MNSGLQDTPALCDGAATNQTPLSLNCTAGELAKNTRGGKRPGAGRRPLPLGKLRRPDLADRRALKKARPTR